MPPPIKINAQINIKFLPRFPETDKFRMKLDNF